MDWKKYDQTIRQFAQELNCEIEEDNFYTIGSKSQILKFTDKDGLSYEFRHTMPESSVGSRIKFESDKGDGDVYIKSKQVLFFTPKLKIKKGHFHSGIRYKLEKLQENLGEFTWRTNGRLKFTTPIIDLELETLRLIRELHIEISTQVSVN